MSIDCNFENRKCWTILDFLCFVVFGLGCLVVFGRICTIWFVFGVFGLFGLYLVYLGCVWPIWDVFGLFGLCLAYLCCWFVGKHLPQQRCVFQPYVSFVVEIVYRKVSPPVE